MTPTLATGLNGPVAAPTSVEFELHKFVTRNEMDPSAMNGSGGGAVFNMYPVDGNHSVAAAVQNMTSGYIPGEEMMSQSSNAILIVIYTLTTLLAVCGNILVIVVFTVGKRCRSDLRGFLINLACSDLIMSIFCMPFTFTMTMLKNWIFSPPMCPIVLYLQTCAVTASVCTNMAIGIDRFWVVMFPLKSRITKSRSKWVIAVIWVIALSLSTVQLAVGRSSPQEVAPGYVVWDCVEIWPEPSEIFRRAYTFFILSSTYLIPLSILAITYGFVGWKLWQRTTPGNADEARDTQQLKSKRKVIKMLVVVVLLFGICWLPLHVFILVIDFHPHLVATPSGERFFYTLYYCVHWLAMSNSFVNPIIYGFLNDSFRGDLKRLLRLWCPCCRELACLSQDMLSRESTYRAYSRHGHNRDSTSGSMIISNDSKKRLLSVRMNGCGKCETELGTREALLVKNGAHKPQRKLPI